MDKGRFTCARSSQMRQIVPARISAAGGGPLAGARHREVTALTGLQNGHSVLRYWGPPDCSR